MSVLHTAQVLPGGPPAGSGVGKEACALGPGTQGIQGALGGKGWPPGLPLLPHGRGQAWSQGAWTVSVGACVHLSSVSQMKMPSKKLAHIPVYTLGFESPPQRTSMASSGPSRRGGGFQCVPTLSAGVGGVRQRQ